MKVTVDAGRVFAGQLAADSVTVTGHVTRATARPTDVPVAQHPAAPLPDIVHAILKHSDNDSAETLLRMTALGAVLDGLPVSGEAGSTLGPE